MADASDDAGTFVLPETTVSASASTSPPPARSKPKAVDNTVQLIFGGEKLAVWENIRITRGVERVPPDFEISVTERFPDQLDQVFCRPGQPCQLKIGEDLILTGYVDRYLPALRRGMHSVSVQGRGMSEDLVDCSAELADQHWMLSAVSTLALAKQVAQPFGISVTALDGDGPTVPQFNALIGQTPWEIIEMAAKAGQLLVYEGTDGNLVLAQVGSQSMASGFAEGVNVEEAAPIFSMDGRFSPIEVYPLSTDFMGETGSSIAPVATSTDAGVEALKRADGSKRIRPRKIIVDQAMVAADSNFPQRTADWQKARNYGRSQAVHLTCDNWRDSAGNLWEPNRKAEVHLPHLKIHHATWVISEVTFLRGPGGEHAELTLMPPDAFTPEPTIITPFDSEVAAFLNGQTTAGNGGGDP